MAEQEPFTAGSLAELYAAVSAEGGVTIDELSTLVDAFSTRPIASADIQAYREGRKPWKKLRDEVVPVEHLLRKRYPEFTQVRFPLDDQPPDAWAWSDGHAAIGIEVTGALARAGTEVAKGLKEQGIGKGFIGLQDGESQARFDAARTRRRVTSSRVGVDSAVDEAIAASMAEKDKEKFAGQVLLIVAPLGSSPNRSQEDVRSAHAAKAVALPFSRVHVADVARRSEIIDLK
ncbi:hypothetical protein [Sphingomonas sp. BK345]|uniref:hypothetical protein n=1 Tax=Sphingomonas sp. BK345 TaxID=2586980 RepID=UPI00161A407E|nr:hypothetical protein [Sphingomonas sp. BK345]MBB3473552.1 hypothetical protein [Sphingomonas sp. BK345]